MTMRNGGLGNLESVLCVFNFELIIHFESPGLLYFEITVLKKTSMDVVILSVTYDNAVFFTV